MGMNLSFNRVVISCAGFLLVVALLTPVGVAQSKNEQPAKDKSAASGKKTAESAQEAPDVREMMKNLPPEALAMQKIWSAKTLAEKVDVAVDFVHKYPNYSETYSVAFAVFYEPKTQEKKTDPAELRAAIKKFLDGTTAAPSSLRCQFYDTVARELDKRGILTEDAIGIAKQGIALLNQDQYVEFERNRHDGREASGKKRNPKYETEPFSEAESIGHYKSSAAGQYATLGNLYLRSGNLDLAEDAYQNSYKILVVKDASVGLSKIAEQRGDQKKALDYYVDAMLTGRLKADEIAHLRELYAKVNSGGDEGFDRYLDDVYRSRYKNPLPTDPYYRTVLSGRVVVAELVTGAGCEPCMSVDMAFEAALKRYSRRDLILLAYDWNAPTEDPLSNFGVESRVKYYGLNGAPNLMLDGKKTKIGEGASSEAERVFKNLDNMIETAIVVPAKAAIHVSGKLADGKVEAKVAVNGLPQQNKNLRLHIALVSKEVSYSGENGLRFHSMVMRDLARKAASEEFGFPIKGDSANMTYVFDLKKISADILRYYDWNLADLKKRTHGMIEGSYKEKKNVIAPRNLAVVAFVQDDSTKEILQGSYAEVPESATTSEESEVR